MAEGLLLRRIFDVSYYEIGEVFSVSTHLNNYEEPKQGQYVELTAGLSGSGGYNQGLLSNESISGSFPLVQATAVLTDGPMQGKTIRLINTERGFLRAGQSGTFEQDALQQHSHGTSTNGRQGRDVGRGGSGITVSRGDGWSMSVNLVNSGRRGIETRPRNLGVIYYMRVK